MSLKSTTRTSVISRLQQYELAAADRVDVDVASYGGSSIGIRTPKEINASALMARNKPKNSRQKQLRGAAAPPLSPEEQRQQAAQILADELRSMIAGPQA